MSKRFRIAGGVVAVWDGAQDILPFLNPLGYLSRIKFHSSLQYIRLTKTLTFTLSIPETGAVAQKVASYTLGAHGVAGQPFIVGKIVVNGVPVAFSGSVPVHQFASSDSYGRFLSLGVTSTGIVVHEYSVQPFDGYTQSHKSRPAQTFTITVEVTDLML